MEDEICLDALLYILIQFLIEPLVGGKDVGSDAESRVVLQRKHAIVTFGQPAVVIHNFVHSVHYRLDMLLFCGGCIFQEPTDELLVLLCLGDQHPVPIRKLG